MPLFVGALSASQLKTVRRPPFVASSERLDDPVVLPGDWDLAPTPVAPDPQTHRPGLAAAASASDPVPVAIGRDGDVIRLLPVDAVPHANGNDADVSVRVVGRHPLWQQFRRELIALTEEANNGQAYAPLTHIDLRQIPALYGPERFEAIARHMSQAPDTILDIGANLGYMCEELEKIGKRCVAVESDPHFYRMLTRLKRANSCGFEAVNEDICSFVERRAEFHTVLALAVFHHFLKSESDHERLIELLRRLKMDEMFFWAHNPDEAIDGHMKGAFRNYQPEEFAQFIVDHSCLRRFREIGRFSYRVLYHLHV